MTKLRSLLGSRELVRLLDQGTYSASTFIATLLAARLESVGSFAYFSVALAISFVAVAGSRALGVTGVVIAGGRAGLAPSESVSWSRSLLAALGIGFVGSVILLAVARPEATVELSASVLPLALCLIDSAKQTLVYSGNLKRSLAASVAVLSGTIAVGALAGSDSRQSFIADWSIAMTVCGVCLLAVGVIAKTRQSRRRAFRSRDVASRLAVESLAAAGASQLALLLLYFLNSSDAVAGYRLAYSVGFAPAFMLIQGLTPLMVGDVATALSKRGQVRTVVRRWWLTVAVCVTASGVASLPIIYFWLGSNSLSSVLPFLSPVGFSILAAQWLEASFHSRRGDTSPARLLRVKLSVLVGEACLTAVAIPVFGLTGVVIALVLTGIGKVALAARMYSSIPQPGSTLAGAATVDSDPRTSLNGH